MSAQEDRRASNLTQRIPFDGIVEIGGAASTGSGFEAQGVDVSTGGMHLRTAYLPEIGRPLLCRFDEGGQEIQAEGDVVWRREGNRGGEFGIRFTNLDGAGASRLMDVCGVNPDEGAIPADPGLEKASPGTHVRLHIDGLGSPMKARVRDARHGEVMVGSNLEFLRVGRPLELEDVDHNGKMRPAHIDRVEVEVDPTSRVPQLVVALRFDDVPGDSDGVAETTSGTAAVPHARSSSDSPRAGSRASIHSAEGARKSIPSAEGVHMSDDEMQMAGQMKSKVSQMAIAVGPAMARLGARAKTTVALLLSKAKERSRSEATAPRRMTAPPPGGALHAEGKRVVREDSESADSGVDAENPRRQRQKKALVYSGAGALGVLVLVLATRGSSSAPPGAGAGAQAPAPTAAHAGTTGTGANPPGGAEPVAASGDGVQAHVPLFGPTTLSTTEPAAPPAPAATAAMGGFLAPGGSASGSAFASSNGSSRDENADDEGPDGEGRKTKHPKVPPFIHGKVVHPNVLHVRMDGRITAMHAARSSTGFTVALPDLRALDGGSALGAKDARIASVHVVNGSKGAELSFQFKDGVPAYAVRAKGHELSIALGRPSPDGEESTHGSTAKKDGSQRTPHKGSR